MRKALFCVVLVAASFGGGAVVNGPGLRWVRTLVMNRLGLPTSEKGQDAPSHGSPPPLAIEPSEVDPGQQAPRTPDAGPTTADADAKTDPKPPDLGTTAANATVTARAESSAPAEPARALDPGPISLPPTDPSVSPTSSRPEPSTASGSGEWAEIRRGLKEAGVSRYTMGGEPGGRVRFECVIPVAGRRAVGQHFEAEADDETQAARAVLKRIALWHATEADAATP